MEVTQKANSSVTWRNKGRAQRFHSGYAAILIASCYGKGRVTASTMHAVLVSNIDKPAVSTVKNVCYPKHRHSTH